MIIINQPEEFQSAKKQNFPSTKRPARHRTKKILSLIRLGKNGFTQYIPATLLAVLIALNGAGYAQASGGDTCRQKEQAILEQLEIAKQYNNRGRTQGLEKALKNVRTWCSDSGLLTEANENVEEKQEKIKEREADLAEAVSQGKGTAKIAKRKQKLEEARRELREALSKRDTLLESVNKAGE